MKGEGDEPGFLTRIKTKKLERAKAMDEIAALLRKEGISVTGNQCDNKWKSLLARFKTVEDHNNTSGNGTMQGGPYHAELSDIPGERASTRPSITAGTGVPVILFDDGVDNNDLAVDPRALDDDFDPLLAMESAASSTPMTSRPSAEIILPWPAVEHAGFSTMTALVPVAQKRSRRLITMSQDDKDSADDQLLDLAPDCAHQSTSSTPTLPSVSARRVAAKNSTSLPSAQKRSRPLITMSQDDEDSADDQLLDLAPDGAHQSTPRLPSVSARPVAAKKSASLPSAQKRSRPLITMSQDDEDRADDQLLDLVPEGAHRSTSSTPTSPSVSARRVVAKKSASFSPARLHGSNNTSSTQCSLASSTVTPSKKADRPAPAGKAPGGSSSQSKKGTTISGKSLGKKKKINKSRSRSSEIITWATAYEANQREDEQLRREMMAQQHREKMGLLGRLVEALENK